MSFVIDPMKIPPGTLVSDEEWEAICDGCGKCCAMNTMEGMTKQEKGCYACPALDTSTNRCTNYKDRFERQICVKVAPINTMYLHSKGVLPDSCAYVRHMQGKAPLPRPVAEAKLIPFLLAPESFQKKYRKSRLEWANFMGTKY